MGARSGSFLLWSPLPGGERVRVRGESRGVARRVTRVASTRFPLTPCRKLSRNGRGRMLAFLHGVLTFPHQLRPRGVAEADPFRILRRVLRVIAETAQPSGNP